MCPVGGQRHALDVTLVADGDDAILALDQVFVFNLAFDIDDFGLTRCREFFPNRCELAFDDLYHAGARCQNRQILGDFDRDLVQLVGNFVASKGRQPCQTQIENCFGLFVGQAVAACFRQSVAWIGNQLDQRRHVFGGPIAAHQLLFGVGGRGREANELDDIVDIGNRDRQADQNVGAVAGFGQQVLDAFRYDFLAEGGERRNHVLEVQAFRPSAIDRQHVGAKRRLQVGILVEVV